MSLSLVTAGRPRGLALAARYAAFAAVATLINLAVQAISLALYVGTLHLAVAIALGTAAGLVPKYLLDKRWIFDERSSGSRSHARQFFLYTLMACATTAIFWSMEWVFDRIGHGGRLHYVGALLGLGLGYWAKYRLDRRLTFGVAR